MEKIKIDLFIVTAESLGFTQKVSRIEIFKRAQSFNLVPCPPDLGPRLRLEILGQSTNEWFHIAMKPIKHSANIYLIFSLGRIGGATMLRVGNGDPKHMWTPDSNWVLTSQK